METPIIVALITLSGIIVNLIANWKNNVKNIKLQKETQESNEKLQKELTQKTIHSNVQTKTSIEWINQIRTLSADLLSNYEALILAGKNSYLGIISIAMNKEKRENAQAQAMYTGFYNVSPELNEKKGQELKREHGKEFNERSLTIRSLSNQIGLYFVDGEDHSQIIVKIENLREAAVKMADYMRDSIEFSKDMSYYEEKINNMLEIQTEMENASNEFRQIVSEYLNLEWKKVKQNK